MLVSDVMTTEVVTVPADEQLRRAVYRMLRNRVGSVVVTSDDTPVGIVTESDALKAAYAAERSLADLPVSRAASRPLATTRPRATVQKALDTMKDRDVKKLPVVEDFDLVGIVTTTDLARAQPELLAEAHRLEAGRSGWEGDD